MCWRVRKGEEKEKWIREEKEEKKVLEVTVSHSPVRHSFPLPFFIAYSFQSLPCLILPCLANSFMPSAALTSFKEVTVSQSSVRHPFSLRLFLFFSAYSFQCLLGLQYHTTPLPIALYPRPPWYIYKKLSYHWAPLNTHLLYSYSCSSLLPVSSACSAFSTTLLHCP